ncbi:MAG: AraC family transcriptional regulator, partial [Paludibacter sp.]
KDAMIYPLWTIFSVSLYLIGYMGLKQKPVNPTFDLEEQSLDFVENATTQFDKKVAHQKILELFENDKIYLNNQLNIMDVANAVGTNRTYISVLINMYYNQNFCTFVNAYRIAEMEKVIYQNPTSSYDLLMQSCGFGSVNSMKRSVSMHTGMPISEWKKQLVSIQPKA